MPCVSLFYETILPFLSFPLFFHTRNKREKDISQNKRTSYQRPKGNTLLSEEEPSLPTVSKMNLGEK